MVLFIDDVKKESFHSILMLKFIYKGFKNFDFDYLYIYNKFLPDMNYKWSKPFDFEYY